MLAHAVLLLAQDGVGETEIARVPEEIPLDGAISVFAPGGAAAALIFSAGSDEQQRRQIWWSGSAELSTEWEMLDGLVISEDGAHHAYRAGRRLGPDLQEWRVVHDGREGRDYSWVGRPALRPDGREVAYWAGKGVTIEAERRLPGGTGFDGPTVAAGRSGGEYFVVKGYKESDPFDPGRDAPTPVYRADGKDLAWLGMVPKGWLILVGSKEFGPYQQATPPQWSASGKRIAWAGVPLSGQGRIYAGRKELGKGSEALGPPVISADGKHVAWPSRRDGDLVVVVDEMVVAGPFGRLGHLRLAPKGVSVAFIATDGERSMSSTSGGRTDILDWMELEGPDSFWKEGGSGSWQLVVNDRRHPEKWDYLGIPVFSADGKRVAVEGRQGDDWFLLVVETQAREGQSGWRSEAYQAVGAPRFDGDEIVFGARKGSRMLQIRTTAPPSDA